MVFQKYDPKLTISTCFESYFSNPTLNRLDCFLIRFVVQARQGLLLTVTNCLSKKLEGLCHSSAHNFTN